MFFINSTLRYFQILEILESLFLACILAWRFFFVQLRFPVCQWPAICLQWHTTLCYWSNLLYRNITTFSQMKEDKTIYFRRGRWLIFACLSVENLELIYSSFFACLRDNTHTFSDGQCASAVSVRSCFGLNLGMKQLGSVVLDSCCPELIVFFQSTDSRRDWWLFSLWLAVFSRSLCCVLVDRVAEWLAGCCVGLFCMYVWEKGRVTGRKTEAGKFCE